MTIHKAQFALRNQLPISMRQSLPENLPELPTITSRIQDKHTAAIYSGQFTQQAEKVLPRKSWDRAQQLLNSIGLVRTRGQLTAMAGMKHSSGSSAFSCSVVPGVHLSFEWSEKTSCATGFSLSRV